jgi:hypothetical protein
MGKRDYTTERYKWNDEVGNYCLAKGVNFIVPLQPLKLSEVDKSDLAESLQAIYFKRTGRINAKIGLDYERDKALAKEMDCWD